MKIDSLNQPVPANTSKKKKKMNKQSKLQRNTQYNIVYEDEKLENNASEKLSV